MKRSSILKFVLPLCLVCLLVICGRLAIYFSNVVPPWSQQNAIECTLEWGGLAELPKNHKQLHIEKRGNMFARQFLLEFESDQAAIESWIEESPRLKNQSTISRADTLIFEIYPGEKNAFGGKVKINKNKVWVDMSTG